MNGATDQRQGPGPDRLGPVGRAQEASSSSSPPSTAGGSGVRTSVSPGSSASAGRRRQVASAPPPPCGRPPGGGSASTGRNWSERAAKRIPPGASWPRPGSHPLNGSGWRRRSWLKRLAQKAPIRASTRSPTLAPADPDRSETDESVVGGVRQGRAQERRVERADRLGAEVRAQPLDLLAEGRDHEHDVRQGESVGDRLAVVASAGVVLDRPPAMGPARGRRPDGRSSPSGARSGSRWAAEG